MVPAPANWRTPRHMHFQTNMRAPLPAAMADDGKTDALLILDVADAIDTDAIVEALRPKVGRAAAGTVASFVQPFWSRSSSRN